MFLRARQFQFTFPRPALVMGIVNVTPDSFSDGGRYLETEAAIAHGLELAAQGAEIIDVGGESTRPGAAPVSEAEELRRVLPVIGGLVRQARVPVSIDTMKPAVARAALAAGASLVNDIAAAHASEDMWQAVAEAGAGYVVMHIQGTPQTMQAAPTYADVVREVDEFFTARLERVLAAGVPLESLVIDPGLGFGKTARHNLQLLADVAAFKKHGRPVLVGASRKSFIGATTGAAPDGRLPGSLACAVWAVAQGAQIVRAHDVAETVGALRMAEAILAETK